MIPYIVFVILSFLLLKNYKKYIVLVFVYSTWIMHIELWGQNMSMYLFALSVMLFPFKVKDGFCLMKKFPVKWPFCVMVLSLILTNYFAKEKHTPTMIAYILSDYVMVYIIWVIYMEDPIKTMNRYVCFCFVFAVIVGGYSVFETITRSNPFVEVMNDNGIYSVNKIITEIRFGLKRSQGLFSMHTTNGGVAVILFVILCIARLKGFMKKDVFTSIVIVLLSLTVLFTGARSAIIALVLMLPMFVDKRNLKIKYILFFSFFVLCCVFISSGYLSDIFASIINTDKVSGSNTDMRNNQLIISLEYLNQSPIFGNGIQYTFNKVVLYDKDINGAESIWFTTMINQGFIGVFGYLFYFVNNIVFTFKQGRKRYSFYVIGILAFYTMSSIPNVPVTFTFIPLFMMIEMDKLFIGKFNYDN